MILEPGKNLLIAHRRLFESDQTRFFVGTVDAYHDGLVAVTGHSWNRDPYTGLLAMKGAQCSKIVAVASGMVLVYVLPDDVDTATLRIETDDHQNVTLTDGEAFTMDLTERKLRV